MDIGPREEKLPALKLTIFQYMIVGILTVLVFGLWRVQILGRTGFQLLAAKNSIRKITIIAGRGKLFDRENRLLVGNYPSLSCFIFSQAGRDIGPDLPLIARGLKLDLDQLRASLRYYRAGVGLQSGSIKQDLTDDDIAFIEAHRNELPELQMIEEERRLYPGDGFAAHLIGYLGQINAEELNGPNQTTYRMGDYIGRAGVEQVYDELLRGRDGSSDVMVDSHGSVLSYSKTQPAVPGGDLRLTIDIDLQKVAELSLGERNGAIVAMDARNGEILALVSRPSFDANALSVRVNRVDWIGLTNDPNAPLMNKAIQSQLAPGSTFKVLMSVAGLQEGIAQHLKVTCTGGWNPYGKFHRCHENHGAVDINSAIPFSCDTFYYILGDKLGIDRIFQYATRFGFGQKTGIDLPAEQPGLMPSPEWSRRYHHAEWFPDDTLNVSIGQGAVEASPIQLARIIGGIASRGHLVRPHVVFQDQLPASFRDSLLEQLPGSGEANLPIDPANWEIITDGMAAVTQPGIFHTAPRAHLDAIDFAGKTGTAQLKGHGEIRDANESATSTPNMWFVGVAPRRNPELVVAVLWQNGRSSSDAAAIAANLVAAYVEKRRRIEHNLPTDAAIQAEIGAVWAESDKTNKKGEGAVQIRAGRFFIDPKNTLSESNGN